MSEKSSAEEVCINWLLTRSFSELRLICKHLRDSTTKKFDAKTGEMSIGSFMILRFLSPALIGPHAYGLYAGFSVKYLNRFA